MILTAFKDWAEKQTEYDTLDHFLNEYLDPKDWREITRLFVYELYNMAQVFGHMFETLEELRSQIEKQKPTKSTAQRQKTSVPKKSKPQGKALC